MRNQEDRMRKEYDIDGLDPRPNPYAKELKQQITIRLDIPVIEYFKDLSADCGIPYQTLLTFSHHLRSEAAKRRGIPDSTTTATF